MRRREYLSITKFARRCDWRSSKFNVNIVYKTRTDITDRTVEAAEDFCLGEDEYQVHVVELHASEDVLSRNANII